MSDSLHWDAGFNIAEAVNFGPPDWIPYGTDVLEKYRKDRKAATLSHDNLLVSLVQGAVQVAAKQQRTASDAAACSTNAQVLHMLVLALDPISAGVPVCRCLGPLIADSA